MRIKIMCKAKETKPKQNELRKVVPNPNYVPPSSIYTKKRTIKVDTDKLTAERDAALDILCKLERLGIPTLEAENIVPGSVRRQDISPDGRYEMVSFIIAT